MTGRTRIQDGLFSFLENGNRHLLRLSHIVGLASCSHVDHTYPQGGCLVLYTAGGAVHIDHVSREVIAEAIDVYESWVTQTPRGNADA